MTVFEPWFKVFTLNHREGETEESHLLCDSSARHHATQDLGVHMVGDKVKAFVWSWSFQFNYISILLKKKKLKCNNFRHRTRA